MVIDTLDWDSPLQLRLVTDLVLLLEKNHASGFRRAVYKYCLSKLIAQKLPPVKRLRKLLTTQNNFSIQMTVMTQVFSTLTHLSRLGGSSDIEPVKELLENGFKLGGSKALEALKIINSGRATFDQDAVVKKIRKFIGTEALIELFDCMIYVSRDKGEIAEEKLEFMTQVAIDLGFQAELIPDLESRYIKIDEFEAALAELEIIPGDSGVMEEIRAKRDPVRGAFKILGIERDSANDVIKARYKKVIFEQHPDRLVAKGITGKALDKARGDFAELLAAYELIRKERQIR
jgi:DnaJ like chaperone protein